MKILVAIIVTLLSFSSFAQLTRKEKKAARKGTTVDEPTTLNPGTSDSPVMAPKVSERKVKKSHGPTYNAQKEFEDRMSARAKTYRKNEKNLMKPQYSNPAYFGHKRRPKKHSADKMKYCKQCGIRH